MNKFEETMSQIAEWHFTLSPFKKLVLYLAIALAGIGGCSVIQKSNEKYACDNGGLAVIVGHDDNNTLWDIAENHCTGNIQVVVDKLFKEYGNDIQPGQLIKLP